MVAPDASALSVHTREGTHEGNVMSIWEQKTTRDYVVSLENMALFVQRMYYFAITNADEIYFSVLIVSIGVESLQSKNSHA